jgi:hypothetical protein
LRFPGLRRFERLMPLSFVLMVAVGWEIAPGGQGNGWMYCGLVRVWGKLLNLLGKIF